MSEFERIARLRALFGATHPRIPVGIGDDAAVLEARADRKVVVSIDASVEGTHFRREFASIDVLAARAFTAASSDLAAMGAEPLAAFVSLIAPASMNERDFDAIAAGIARASTRYALPVAGGNLARGGELSITTTVLGEAHAQALSRGGAKVGDDVYVTGTLGRAHLGLRALLTSTLDARAQAWIDAWRDPVARIAEGRALASVATSCIDLSDGLAQDVAHIAHASNVRIEIDVDSIPRDDVPLELAERLGTSALEACVSGGEDYELCFTLPRGAPSPVAATRIGRVVDARGDVPGVAFVKDGAPVTLDARGHDHFDDHG